MMTCTAGRSCAARRSDGAAGQRGRERKNGFRVRGDVRAAVNALRANGIVRGESSGAANDHTAAWSSCHRSHRMLSHVRHSRALAASHRAEAAELVRRTALRGNHLAMQVLDTVALGMGHGK